MAKMFCQGCGKEFPEDTEMCSGCDRPLVPATIPEDVPKVAAKKKASDKK